MEQITDPWTKKWGTKAHLYEQHNKLTNADITKCRTRKVLRILDMKNDKKDKQGKEPRQKQD